VRRLGWQQWLVLSLFLLALVVAGFFGVRAVRRAAYWRAHRDVPVRAWMSVPYVAHSYRVPPRVIYEAVGVKPVPPPDRRTLRQIAREQSRPVEEVIKEVQDAIAEERLLHPPPPPAKRTREGETPP
jgi:uncharacterized membrane protein